MISTVKRKSMALVMALLMCFSMFASFGTTAQAAGERSEIYMVSFPRDAETNRDHWDRDNLQFMNGWYMDAYDMFATFAVGSYEGKVAYCIEPGTPIDNAHTFTAKDETFWDNYPSSLNKTIDADTIKSLIGRILQYGYTGNIDPTWVSQNSAAADKLAHVYATQLLIWETIVGERDEQFAHVSTGGKNPVLDFIKQGHPLRSRIMDKYNSMVTSVQNHSKIPSFMAKSRGKAPTIELEWDGSQYTASLTDTNKVLGNYTFSSDYSAMKFTTSGDVLTITSSTAPTGDVTVSASKKDSKRMGLVVWDDGTFGPGVGQQNTVTYTQSVTDPIAAYLKLNVSYGSAKIVKTSEDGKVEGITFHITGKGIDQTVTTNSRGEVQIDNLQPGEYTVMEQVSGDYVPQEPQKVTVQAGQTATISFNNSLQKGSLTVTKNSEDGLNSGVRFHLFGTSSMGETVDLYATTNSSGVAQFTDIPIGSGYTLEEVDTAIRYVVPATQTANIEWEKATNASFRNVLKKFNITLNKVDGETGTQQGDATLAGAVYGIYKDGELVDTYTTDSEGHFTTSYYTCGSGWTVQEITPSEGYLLDETVYPVGADPKQYEVEFNSAPAVTSPETVQKGKITVIKHCDDGSTQIETPEVGAEFAVFLKSSGSYDSAKDSERDYLTCDENGYAETKLLPYGVYTVRQTKGWDGRELMKDFDVFINKDGGVYRYLINNAPFTSYVKVIKTDAETGKAIPYAGAGFQIYDPNGQLVTMQFTYPAVTVIDTFYTTTDGTLITPEVLPYGTGYSLVEVQAPYGYVLNSEPVYFDITPAGSSNVGDVTVVEVERPNMPQKGTISITKLGEAFSSVTALGGAAADEDGNEVEFPVSYQPVYEEKQLAGAVYEVTAAEDIVTPDGTLRYAAGEVVATLTTAQDSPVATEPLYLGKYQVREIEAPFGTVLDTESHLVELTYAGQEVEITEASTTLHDDRQKIKISLNKVLEQDERFQLGMNGEITTVQFGLYASEDITAADGSVIPADGLIETINCAEDGSVVFVTDLPLGSYHVKEISTDKHYTLPDTVYPVVFEYAGQDVAVVEVALNDGEPIPNELIYGSIKGLKIDRENQETIAGALFGLFRPDVLQFTSDTAILTATSDEEGVFSFENVPLGNWIVRELQPAEGYLPNTDIHHVQVERDEQVIEINVVNDRIPELGTTASIGGEKEVNATEVFTLEDVVEYTHLVPGKEYVVKGVLMDKTTGEPLKINSEEVRAETVFTPENPSGTVTVAFEFDSKYIKADTDIVVFENLYQEGRELAVHADLEDENQTVTVKVPEIGTQATIGEEKEVTIDGPVTIDDVVAFKNLTPGKEYSVYGILMDKNTGEALKVAGEEIHAESTFTPETPDGETIVQFTFDTTGLVDSTEIVAFESLSREGIELAAHANIEDPAQTVKVTVTGPRIGTKATVDSEKEVSGDGVVTIEDIVSYKGLTAGKEYKLTGTLMNKTTGEPFKLNGEEIRSEVVFTPEKSEEEVTVSFPFDTSWVNSTTDIVVFEKLSLNGKEVAVHEDIGDKEQTVTIVVTRPEIGTTATIGGKKEAAPSKEITIDDVVSYKNLTPGTEYKLVGVLMDKATGNPFKVGDKEIKAETVFTPEKADGETVVKFTFDGSGITQTTELVVFETLYQGEVKIAAHEDINDEGQTVKIVPVTPGKPTTPNPGNPQTGDRSIMGFWIGLGAVALGGLVSGIIMYSRKRKEQDGE